MGILEYKLTPTLCGLQVGEAANSSNYPSEAEWGMVQWLTQVLT